MAILTFQFPPKSQENRKPANVCAHCRHQGPSTSIAAAKLKDGIIHLTIEQLEVARRDGQTLTRADMVRLWNALIDSACQKDCGCAQVLRQHVRCEELKQFWAATRIELSEEERLSQRQKMDREKRQKKMAEKAEAETEDDAPPAPLGRNNAANRRYKKRQARKAQLAAASVPTAPDALNNDALGALQQALPAVVPAAPPVPSATPDLGSAFGLPITFVETFPARQKTVKK